MKGYANFETELAGKTLVYPFLVAKSLDPVLIGIHMLKTLGSSLDFTEMRLLVNGVSYPLFKNTHTECRRVLLKESRYIKHYMKLRSCVE